MTSGLADLTAALADRPLIAIAGAYAGGVLTSLTPCLYPMIPVTVPALPEAGARNAGGA